MSPIVITGAAGLIGFSIATRLSAAGRPVLGLDRVAPSEPATFPFRIAELGDIHALYAALAGGADGIIHCGAVSGPMLGRDNPYGLAQTNITGTLNVLEAARVMQLRRVVYCSSCMTYGDTPAGLEPVDESAPQSATDIYGASKTAGDVMTRAYAAQHGVDAGVLRFCWVYGPRRATDCLIRTLILDGQRNRPTVLAFGQDYHRQFVHIDDVVAALTAAYDAPMLGGRAYNITGGERRTFAEIGAAVRDFVPGTVLRLGPGPDPQDYRQARFDISAARRDLGWTPQVDLRAGIAAYVGWLQRHEREAAA